MPGGRSAGLVLAAGASSRMGSPKQLLPLNGRPLLEVVVAEVCASRLDQVLVVLGAKADELLRRVPLGRAQPLLNADHALGMSSSLQAGLRALPAEVERAVVILGDQPAISAALLDELLDLEESSGLPAAAFSFDGLLHPPVLLRRELWPDLMSLEGDVGCRRLIRARPELVAALPVAGSSRHPIDVDTPADYERLLTSEAWTARR
ncbi:MAG: nucleotidyltransferase family protein [Candidatus Dormibacteraeota bacterium]|nr:nucleotidyltransferase family protein [Candidatus Dormibacteraeota bacterium]